jgi:hypothetical protein
MPGTAVAPQVESQYLKVSCDASAPTPWISITAGPFPSTQYFSAGA